MPAGKQTGQGAVLLIDGYDMLSAKPRTLSLKLTSLTEQSDGLGDPNEAFSPVGKVRALITQGVGFFSSALNSIHDAMATKLGSTPAAVARVGVFGCMGQVAGGVFWGLAGLFSNEYEVLVDDSKLTKANAAHLITGLVERGMIVQPLAAQTVDWNTKNLATQIDYTLDPSQYTTPITSNTLANPSVVTTPVPHGLTTGDIILISGVITSNPTINGERVVTVITPTTFSVPVNVTTAGTGGSFVRSNSSNGASGYQEVTALSGFTGYVGKLRDSPDNVTYADLLTFANVTAAPNAQRVTVAGVVDRYVCHDGDVTGAGSLTVFSGVARS
jgi:hypothetical protein